MATELPDILLVKEAAEYLRVDVSTIYHWIKSGDLPAVRLGTTYRIARADIAAILASGL